MCKFGPDPTTGGLNSFLIIRILSTLWHCAASKKVKKMPELKRGQTVEMLTKLEELILLSVLKLGENAYGTTIYKYLQEVTGKKLSLGGVYFPLDRLTKRGYLSAYSGAASSVRRGLSKRYYRLTPRGVTALNEINRMNEVLWAGFTDLARPIPK